MAATKNRFWKAVRRLFRWCRIALLLLLFIFVFAAIYFNTIGLPDFLKRPLLSELRKNGWKVQFTEMRWHWYRGIVVVDGSFSKTNEPITFTAKETALNFDFGKRLRSKLSLQDLSIVQGDLAYEVSPHHPPILAKGISATVHFRPKEQLQLKSFEAQLGEAKIKINGWLTNYFALAQWQSAASPEGKAPRLEEILKFIERFHFAGPPELQLQINGDARDWNSVNGRLQLSVPAAETPWGSFKNLQLAAERKSGTNATQLQLTAGETKTEWGKGKALSLNARLAPDAAREMWQTQLHISLNQLEAGWTNDLDAASARIHTLDFRGRSTHAWTNFSPRFAEGTVRFLKGDLHFTQDATTVSAVLPEAEANFTFDPSAADTITTQGGPWKSLEPFRLAWRFDLRGVKAPDLELQKVLCSGEWLTPVLKLTQFNAELYGGTASAAGTLDVNSRQVRINTATAFDGHRAAAILPRVARRFLADYSWEQPPVGRGEIVFTLPAWTNREPDWNTEVMPTFALKAFVAAEHGANYRSIHADRASASIFYTNGVWNIPDIRAALGSGQMQLGYIADERTKSYDWKIDGTIDPKLVRHELPKEGQQWLDDLQFAAPVKIQGNISGSWAQSARDSVSFSTEIAATNFTFRGEPVDSLSMAVQLTNLLATFRGVEIGQGTGRVEAPEIMVDFVSKKVFFTDVNSTVDPMSVARALGSNLVATLKPFRLNEPPRVRMNGTLHFHQIKDTDLRFDVSARQFDWEWFHADSISGRLNWRGQTLVLTNGNASAYKSGMLSGHAFLDFSPEQKTDYRFQLNFSDLDAQALMAGWQRTNRVEGLLDGQLNLTSADTRGLQTWQGMGSLKLRDGLIWEIPVFGMFSPMLDAIVPGLGKNRANQASANFVISDGVARTDDLEIRASTLRIQYRGSVDFAARVEARVEAEILRDAFAIGKIVSLALTPVSKLFEYKVSGTIERPKVEPVYIPKFLLMTLRPFHTLKSLLPEKEE